MIQQLVRDGAKIALNGEFREKTIADKNNSMSRLTFSQNIFVIHNSFEKIFFLDVKTKVALFGRSDSFHRKTNTTFHYENIRPAVKYDGGSVMVWSCVAASGLG